MEAPERATKGTASGDRRPTRPTPEEPEGLAWKGALAVALVVVGLVVWRGCSTRGAPDEPVSAPVARSSSDDPDLDPRSDDAAGGTAASATPKAPPAPPRCAPAAPQPFVIGDAPREPRKSDGGGGGEADGDGELAPFAVEIGRGTVFDGGFAVGAQREAEGGTAAMIATLAGDGTQGKLVRLGRSRGDMDPPVVAGAGGALLAAMLEPNAGGRAIKIARVEGDHVTWGAELSEGRDESLALDLAVAGARAVIVWDDVTSDGKRSRVMLASVDTASLRSATPARPISQPKTDAETPRVIARPGGYWLAYVARAEEPGKRVPPKQDDAEEDTAAAGETIAHQWIEVAPLDETGTLTATPRPVTPKDGNVLAFDLTLGEDDGVLVAFRDDDTPSGSSGGRVSAVLVRLGGTAEPKVLAGGERGHGAPSGPDAARGGGAVGDPEALRGGGPPSAEEAVGTGVPVLLGHAPGVDGGGGAKATWLAVANASGATQLAALNARGELIDELRSEPALGRGEPIAALADALLVAHPAGKAMKLSVMRCAATGANRP